MQQNFYLQQLWRHNAQKVSSYKQEQLAMRQSAATVGISCIDDFTSGCAQSWCFVEGKLCLACSTHCVFSFEHSHLSGKVGEWLQEKCFAAQKTKQPTCKPCLERSVAATSPLCPPPNISTSGLLLVEKAVRHAAAPNLCR